MKQLPPPLFCEACKEARAKNTIKNFTAYCEKHLEQFREASEKLNKFFNNL